MPSSKDNRSIWTRSDLTNTQGDQVVAIVLGIGFGCLAILLLAILITCKYRRIKQSKTSSERSRRRTRESNLVLPGAAPAVQRSSDTDERLDGFKSDVERDHVNPASQDLANSAAYFRHQPIQLPAEQQQLLDSERDPALTNRYEEYYDLQHSINWHQTQQSSELQVPMQQATHDAMHCTNPTKRQRPSRSWTPPQDAPPIPPIPPSMASKVQRQIVPHSTSKPYRHFTPMNLESHRSFAIHYPSQSELCDFDFAENVEQSQAKRYSYEEGDDSGWRLKRGHISSKHESSYL